MQRVFPTGRRRIAKRCSSACGPTWGGWRANIRICRGFASDRERGSRSSKLQHLEALRDDGRPGLFFSGHFVNLELPGICVARHGLPLHLVYRAATNPHVDWVYHRAQANCGVDLIPKGSTGARAAMDKLRRNEHLGMLVDQKMNDGIAVPFFGIEAMTAPALARFALKFRCPVVPAHCERLRGAHFRVIFDPPMWFDDTGDFHGDVLRAMTRVNQILETWIRERPDHWLWLHKRWPEPDWKAELR